MDLIPRRTHPPHRHSSPLRRVLLVAILLAVASQPGCQATEIAIARKLGNTNPPAVPEGVLAIRNVAFAERETGPLRLDIYRPDPAGESALPVVLYTFGGGWMSGDRNQFQMLELLRLIDRGYALVTADYRYSTDSVFPAQIHDVKAALRWIRANAEQQGFDPNRIAILGPSAGGHLAALAGTSSGVASLEDPDAEDRSISTRVGAVVDFFGPTDFTVYKEQHVRNGLGNSERLWFLDLLVGGPITEHPDLVRMLNPIAYIDPSDPPFLIIHGDEDDIVPLQQSEMLAEALNHAGVDVTLRRVEGGNHGRSEAYSSDALFNEIADFLDRALKSGR